MSHCKKNQNHMLPRRFRTLIAGLLAISTGLSWGAENIGGAKQLSIDDRIIGSLGSAKRVFKQAVKTGPLLSASTAWETRRSLAYPTVRREGVNSWKIWYRAGTPSGERTICYATSKDGVSWTKPKLGIYPHNGGNNNIVLIGSETFVDTPSVFKEDDGYYLYCIEGDVRYVIYHSPTGSVNSVSIAILAAWPGFRTHPFPWLDLAMSLRTRRTKPLNRERYERRTMARGCTRRKTAVSLDSAALQH